MAVSMSTGIDLNVPVARVWAALTEPEHVAKLMWGTQLDTTWQPGTPIFFRGEWEGNKYEDKGTVLTFEPMRRLSYDYRSSMSPLPDVPENYLIITYLLAETATGCRLEIQQDNSPDQTTSDHSQENWGSMLSQLKIMLEN